jgi:hypothetical protein
LFLYSPFVAETAIPTDPRIYVPHRIGSISTLFSLIIDASLQWKNSQTPPHVQSQSHLPISLDTVIYCMRSFSSPYILALGLTIPVLLPSRFTSTPIFPNQGKTTTQQLIILVPCFVPYYIKPSGRAKGQEGERARGREGEKGKVKLSQM